MKTKAEVLAAIKLLIDGYKSRKITHGLLSCPLCISFHTDFKGVPNCSFCPNLAFHNEEYHVSCVARGHAYPYLDYCLSENNANLAKFWERVYNLYETKTEEEIQILDEPLMQSIQSIAEKP